MKRNPASIRETLSCKRCNCLSNSAFVIIPSRSESDAQKLDILWLMAANRETRTRLDDDERAAVENTAARSPDVVTLSALTGENCPAFLGLLDSLLARRRDVVQLTLPQGDGKGIAWLYRNSDVLKRDDEGEFAHFQVSISPDMLARFEKAHSAH